MHFGQVRYLSTVDPQYFSQCSHSSSSLAKQCQWQHIWKVSKSRLKSQILKGRRRLQIFLQWKCVVARDKRKHGLITHPWGSVCLSMCACPQFPNKAVNGSGNPSQLFTIVDPPSPPPWMPIPIPILIPIPLPLPPDGTQRLRCKVSVWSWAVASYSLNKRLHVSSPLFDRRTLANPLLPHSSAPLACPCLVLGKYITCHWVHLCSLGVRIELSAGPM